MATLLKAEGYRIPIALGDAREDWRRIAALSGRRHLLYHSVQVASNPGVKRNAAASDLIGQQAYGDALLFDEEESDELLTQHAFANVDRLLKQAGHDVPWVLAIPPPAHFLNMLVGMGELTGFDMTKSKPYFPAITLARKGGRPKNLHVILQMPPKPPIATNTGALVSNVMIGPDRIDVITMTEKGGDLFEFTGLDVWNSKDGWDESARGRHGKFHPLVMATIHMLNGVRFEPREVNGVERWVGKLPLRRDEIESKSAEIVQTYAVRSMPKAARDELRERTIEGYLNTVSQLAELARRTTDQASRYLSAQMQKARLYEFDPFTLTELTRKTIDDLSTLVPKPGLDKALVEWTAKRPPVTDKRPHPVMYLAFGVGIELNKSAAEQVMEVVRMRGGTVAGKLYLFAYLVTPEVVSMILTDQKMTFSFAAYEHGEWRFSASLTAWLVPALIDIINDQNARVVRESSMSTKMKWKRKAKQLDMKRPLPPPFYTVQFNHHHDRKERKPGPPDSVKPDWQHKWSVDAHTRLLVQRGTLPLDAKLKARLLARRYTLFEERAGDDVQRTLIDRKHAPQREGEWLAIRRVWVKEHESPNRPDLPLIQGVKKVRRA